MSDDDIDHRFDPDRLRIDPGEVWAAVPKKVRRRREHFAMLPMTWYERMKGANGQTCRVAWYLLYLHWKGKGEPIKLPNGMLKMDEISRQSKWRALGDLERRGLITVARRPHRSPIIRLLLV
jgi:hypothetical protein